jgi:hypothetical protein
MVKHVVFDQKNPKIVITGAPGMPGAPGSVRDECHRCEKEVQIAPSTKRLLADDHSLPLLCWECFKILAPEHVGEIGFAGGVRDARRHLGMPD